VSIAAWWIEEYQRECTISLQVIYHTWCRVLGSTSPHINPARVQPVRGLIRGPSNAEILSIHNKESYSFDLDKKSWKGRKFV
jgi:hypothetical protein